MVQYITNSRDLVILLDSPEMVARHNQIVEDYGVDSAFSEYVPHLVMQYAVSNLHHKYRWYTNEMLDVFNGRLKGSTLMFAGEDILPSSQWVNDSEPKNLDSSPNAVSTTVGRYIRQTDVDWGKHNGAGE